MCNPTAEALPLRRFKVIDANDSSQLVLNEGNLDTTFLTEFVGYYLTIDAGTVSGPLPDEGCHGYKTAIC